MKLDSEGKKAVRELVKAVNTAIEKDSGVLLSIETLREIGFEPQLNVKLEINLQENEADFSDELNEDAELELTDEDLRTLRRMKIKF